MLAAEQTRLVSESSQGLCRQLAALVGVPMLIKISTVSPTLTQPYQAQH